MSRAEKWDWIWTVATINSSTALHDNVELGQLYTARDRLFRASYPYMMSPTSVLSTELIYMTTHTLLSESTIEIRIKNHLRCEVICEDGGRRSEHSMSG